MKTTIFVAGILISFNAAGAAVYEFTREPEPRPAPAQNQPTAKPSPTKPAAKPTASTQPAPVVSREQQDAVVQTGDCTAGAACNDL